MFRKDREICDFPEIMDLLRRCDTLRIGFCGDEYPYVIPVSFGVILKPEGVSVYFHGAKRGYKVEQIEKNPKVCVEGDIFYKTEPTAHGITARYESVIGFGVVKKVEGKEMVEGLKSITEHYGYPKYPVGTCGNLSATAVYEVSIDRIFGKRNLPEKR